jgi:hypothetical protein
MSAIIVFALGTISYFLFAYLLTRIVDRFLLWNSGEALTARRATQSLAGFMTMLSLLAVVLLPKNATFAALSIPGVYGGLVLSMLVEGRSHGPGDPYSWLLFAAPINFLFYYVLIRIIEKSFPSFLSWTR